MQRHAFVGESVPAPVPPPRRLTRILGRIGGLVLIGAIVTSITYGRRFGEHTTPFHYADALIIVVLALAPLLLLLWSRAAQKGGLADFASGRPLRMLHALIHLVALVIFVPGNLVLFANQKLDGSPAVIESALVTEISNRSEHGDDGDRLYLVDVTTNVPSPLGRWSFYGSQPVFVAQDTWRRVRPGHSRLVLREHRGFLHIPWFEPNPAPLTQADRPFINWPETIRSWRPAREGALRGAG